jgi:hypothetical protein
MRQQMHEDPETQPAQARTQDEAVAEVLHKLGKIFAEREGTAAPPEPEPPRDPWVDKPGPLIAAEKDVWLLGIVEKLQLAWCKRPGGCRLGRCKRTGRCAEIDKMRPEIERSRAALADAQARWPRPAGLAEPPARRRRRRAGDKP